MKQAIYKLLWLDDKRLIRHARLFGWINLIAGGGAVLGGVILYVAFSGDIIATTEWLRGLSEQLATDTSLSGVNARNVQAASNMLMACSKFVASTPMWASGMLAAMGTLALLQGAMFFRINEIINRDK